MRQRSNFEYFFSEAIRRVDKNLDYGDTRISMGLMFYPHLKQDNLSTFYNDMIRGGEGISDPELAQTMAKKALSALEILESFGHLFQRDREGKISEEVLFLLGGHSVPRTIGCPPGGGIAIGNSKNSLNILAP